MALTVDSAAALLQRKPAMPTPAQSDTVQVTAWYLELVDTARNHYKHYTVYVADDGRLVIAWGRIGTAGQAQFHRHPSLDAAMAVAKRQAYAKAAKGYEMKIEEYRFPLDIQALNTAFKFEKLTGLNAARDEARNNQFQGSQEQATRHYDEFIGRCQALLTLVAADGINEDVLAQWQALRDSWDGLADKHTTAETTLSLTAQVVQDRLLGAR